MEKYDLEALLRDFDSGKAAGLNVVHGINLYDIEMTLGAFILMLVEAAHTLTVENDTPIKHILWNEGAVCYFAFIEGE